MAVLVVSGTCVPLFPAYDGYTCDETAYDQCAEGLLVDVVGDGQTASGGCESLERYHVDVEKCITDASCCLEIHPEIKGSEEVQLAMDVCPGVARIVENCG
jgi:hypothetical protein